MSVPRLVNTLLGLWLFASAFLWPHTTPQLLAAAICGMLVAAIALSSGTFPGARWLNTVVAAALFAFTMSRGSAGDRTRLHDGLLAVAVFLVALIPGFGRSGGRAAAT